MSTRPETRTPSTPGGDHLPSLTAALLLAVAGVVVVVGLVALTGTGTRSTIADPGPATTTGLPVARYLQSLLGVAAVGCALVAALTRAEDRLLRRRAVRLLAPLAAGWALVTGLVYQLTASDLSGRPLPMVLTGQVQAAFVGLPQARAQLLVAVAAVVLLVAALVLRDPEDAVARAMLVVATAGLLPPGFSGHSASAADHELAVASVSVHVVAGALWVGGLAVLAVLVLADRRVTPAGALPALTSFSTLALWCVVVIGTSGVLNASLRVSTLAQLTGSTYGLLLLAKTAALVGLVGLGWWHRRRSLTDLAATGARAAFVRLVVVELAVMAVVVALAVVLSRTPPPPLG